MNLATLTHCQFRPTVFVVKSFMTFLQKRFAQHVDDDITHVCSQKNIENNFVCPFNNYCNLCIYRTSAFPYPIQKAIHKI